MYHEPKPGPCRAERSFSYVKRSPNAQRSGLGHNWCVIFFEEFEIKTGGRLDAVDVTDEVGDVIRQAGVSCGNALVFSPHTTCCVLLAPRAEEMLEAMARAMRTIAPDDGYYAHDDLDIRTENVVENEPANGPAHIIHAFMGKASETIPIVDGRIALGPGQRILFVELDSSRSRRYCIQVVGQ